MKQVSFLHMADLHLDSAFSSLGDESKAKIRRSELEDILDKICKKIQAENIDLLLISGDFYEAAGIRSSTMYKVKNLFSELYKTEIIILPGNHDPLKENSYYDSYEWSSNVHILESSDRVLYLEKYNTCIYNIGAKGSAEQDYSNILNKKAGGDRFDILLFHGTVDMPFEEENYNPMSSDKLLALGMDYIALGHMHGFFRNENGKTVMVNPGSPEPLGFDEEGVHGYVQGRIFISGDKSKKVETHFVEASARQYCNYEINISDCASDIEVIDRIRSEQIKLLPRDLYSISLKGFIPREYVPAIKSITEAFSQDCFFIKIKNQTAPQSDYRQYLEDPGVKGEFVRRILDMYEGEISEERRRTLFMALQYGLQAIENGRVDE